jgi:D-alanyl-D-alanine carboxypeptidase
LDTANPTHSAGKNIAAAQVLRLAEDGMFDLDDPASEHLPPELSFFDANGATIREVLSMRSGIPDLKEFTEDGGFYPAERASTVVEVFGKLREPTDPPGTGPVYASTNYVLLGAIIEHATGRSLAEVLRSDVLDHPGLDGLVYTVEDALAADGFGVQTTPASLARWGYELFGGHVLAERSLKEMTQFFQDPCCDFRYGLGVWDLSADYGTLAVGQEGGSSERQCCSLIRLVAIPEEGIVISVQANTAGAPTPFPYDEVVRLTQVLRDAARS